MSTTDTKTIAEINAATDASLRARTAQTATPTKTAPRSAKPAPKAAANGKAPAKPAPVKAVKPAATPRKALTPAERAAKPVTATIASYVEWLEKTLGRKFTEKERQLAGQSITLYGAYQVSPERKAARAAK